VSFTLLPTTPQIGMPMTIAFLPKKYFSHYTYFCLVKMAKSDDSPALPFNGKQFLNRQPLMKG